MKREDLLRSKTALVLAGALLASGLLSASPRNDLFSDSIELEGPTGRTRGCNVGATAEVGEPAHDDFEATNSVWWNWTAPESGRVTFFTHGSSFDTLLALYTGETLSALEAVDSNDDADNRVFQSLVEVGVESGTRLLIAVDGLLGETGSITLSWHFRPGPEMPPANDRLIDREELTGAAGWLISTNKAAARELWEPLHADAPGSHSVWWSWTAPENGVATFNCGGSTFDTLLAVYTGETMETLEAVASDDGEGLTSYVFFPATAGTEYRIAVDGFRNASGIIALSWELLRGCQDPPVPAGPFPPAGSLGVGETVTVAWGRTPGRRQEVIYGEDDRLDLYEVENPELRRVAESTVALVLIDDLTQNDDGTYSLSGEITGENSLLCPDERFADQPNPACCSGFLVGADMVATAGHCLMSTSDCASFAFVFGFRMENAALPVLTFPESQVYFCDQILGREFEQDYDWAVARLDRPVLGRDPLEVRQDGIIGDEEDLIAIGHPTGWPAKVAGGARVRENLHDAYFVANLDVYGGNSGSPVFNASTLLVEGIVVAGEEDFETDAGGSCVQSRRCPDDGCLGESVTRSTEFAALAAANTSPTTYEIRFGRCDGVPPAELPIVGETSRKEWTATGLEPETTYCWRITAKRECARADGPLWSFTTGPAPEFVRGDADGDGLRNIRDAVSVLDSLFVGQSPLACASAADVDDDGRVDIADPVALLNLLFAGDAEIPPPANECGADPTPDPLTCESFEACP